jgi:hypothetical protein
VYLLEVLVAPNSYLKQYFDDENQDELMLSVGCVLSPTKVIVVYVGAGLVVQINGNNNGNVGKLRRTCRLASCERRGGL